MFLEGRFFLVSLQDNMFLQRKTIINEGDVVIAYLNPSDMKAIQIKAGEMFMNRYGQFPHSGTFIRVLIIRHDWKTFWFKNSQF